MRWIACPYPVEEVSTRSCEQGEGEELTESSSDRCESFVRDSKRLRCCSAISTSTESAMVVQVVAALKQV